MVQTYPITQQEPYDNLARLARELAAWIPALLLGYSALLDPIINFGLATGVEVSGFNVGGESKNSDLARIYFPALLGLTFLCAIFAKPRFRFGLLSIALFGFSYVAFALLSTVWSVAPSSTQTSALYSAILYVTLFLSIATAQSAAKVITPIAILFAVLVAVNLVLVVGVPAGPIGHAGIYDHKNNLGAFGACALFFGLFGVQKSRLFDAALSVFLIAGSLVLIHFSDSKTAQALAFLAPALAAIYLVFQHALRIGFVVTTILLVGLIWSGFLIAGQVFQFTYNDFLFAFYGDTTFTGRTEIWSFVRAYIADAPLFGHGYRGFWSLGTDSPKHLSNIDFIRTIGSSHNGFLDVWLDLGLIGFTLVVALILVTLIATSRGSARAHSFTLLFYSIVFFTIGRNLTESVIMWSTFLDNLLFTAVGFLAAHGSSAQQIDEKPLAFFMTNPAVVR